MQIDFLMNQPKWIDEVAEMVYKEFVVKSSGHMTFYEVREHFTYTYNHTFPITLIAIEQEMCIGTVSILGNDLKIRIEFTPWLASLYVRPEYRGRGVAQKLIESTIDVTRNLGLKRLYLRTESASDFYRGRGWIYVETVSDNKYEKIDVFKLNIL